MRTTTAPAPAPALESIPLDALTSVQGGCGQSTPPPQPQPQPEDGGPEVQTNVNVIGYGGR